MLFCYICKAEIEDLIFFLNSLVIRQESNTFNCNFNYRFHTKSLTYAYTLLGDLLLSYYTSQIAS